MVNTDLAAIWVYLSATPLLGLTLTLVAYSLGHRIYHATGTHPLLNPVVTSVVLVIAVLLLSGTHYETYFEGGQFVHFLLGPATVALAVPLYQQRERLRKVWFPLLGGLLAGSISGAISALLIARGLGASLETQLSLAPKSVTAPVAMGISEQIGGLPSLTAVLVVSTGILGAVVGTRLMALLGVQDDSVKGVAMGVSAHGIGTARAFQVSQQMGAFSGLAMALSACITALILPSLLSFF
ncbi:LrgB family protein [Aestuariirhabdus sp. LZHN29]|uniref:LrgB family protein n=1 Tax=Aestuariirhabdus sp. LZHN29 TaxID=3417462 RepID=UPI003CF8E011